MEYKKLHGFILFVLLHEGKSNLGYRICRFVFGEKAAIRRYFRILFQNVIMQLSCIIWNCITMNTGRIFV